MDIIYLDNVTLIINKIYDSKFTANYGNQKNYN